MRNFYNRIKQANRLLISSVINSNLDGRLYVEVKFLDKSKLGLLDTGANISWIGKKLALENFSKYSCYRKLKSKVRTADGRAQEVIGLVEVKMT